MDALKQLQSSLAGRYDIEREIGAGGMATVYLAHDIRHDRPVALKLLNPELGAVLGVERFLAEIRVTANLQHPNLLPLFDSGEAEGLLYYVMPFVEGESLRARLEREKQLPIDEAVRIAVAVANALEYAHSHGVIHRDLKPENILLQAGEPVIADFGIALAVSKAGGNRITQTGLSLGTPNYMSPEQATGDRVIDGRSDIYSLGAVTYEMLTGEPPHTGHTAQAVIARVLTDKPRPMRTTRAAIPPHVEFAVQHALEKLPADRFSKAHEFADALRGRGTIETSGYYTTETQQAQAAAANWRARLRDPITLGLAAITVAAIAFAMAQRPRNTAPSRVTRFVLWTPDSLRPSDNYPWPAAISPDGSTVVYNAGSLSASMLYYVKTNQIEPQPIPGARGGFQALFSPDGEWLAFEAAGKLRKVRLDGSAPISITDAASANGGDWTTRDELILGSETNKPGLSRVSAAGGELVEFAHPDTAKGETDFIWPIALSNGKAVVFAIWSGSLASAELATASIDKGDVIRLGIKGIRPLAVLDRTLIYLLADGSVMAVKLDRAGRHISGKPIPVLDPVRVTPGNNGNSTIFVSSGGALVTARGGTRSQLSWIARDGAVTAITPDVSSYSQPRLSPDQRRIAVVVGDQEKSDIWIYDLDTKTFSRLSSIDAATSPSWTPDGSRVVFLGLGDKQRYAIWAQAADGGSPPEKLFEITKLTIGAVMSPDGRSVLYTIYNNSTWDIFLTQLDSKGVGIPYAYSSAADETSPRFSPDGKWVAIASNESGRPEVYARSFPNPSARVQISRDGGNQPVWSSDGTRIYYRSGDGIMSAKLALSPTLRVVSRDTAAKDARQLVRTGTPVSNLDVAKDGRFIGPMATKETFQLVVVPNWLPELEQRLAASSRSRR